MAKLMGNREKKGSSLSETATRIAVNPGDYELGSPQSRAAARSIIDAKQKTGKTIRIVFVGAGGDEVSHRLIKLDSS